MENTQRFNVSLSVRGYEDKKKIPYNTMVFQKKEVNEDELIEYIRKGHSFMAELKNYGITPYYKSDGKQCYHQPRKEEDIRQTYFVGVDVDDAELPFSDYIESISNEIQPTFAYTTPNDGIKGHRYRLIYILNEPIQKQRDFSCYYWGIVNTLNECTNTTNKDDCGAKIERLFNGNAKDNIKVFTTYKRYDLEELPKGEEIDAKPKKRVLHKEHTSQVVSDFSQMDFDDFLTKYLTRVYKPITKQDVMYNEEGFALLPKDFKEIKDEWETYQKIKVVGIGEGRKKWLYERLQKIKDIKPTITFDELLFNAVFVVKHRINNEDGKINKDYLFEVVKNVFEGESTIKWFENTKKFEVSKKWCSEHRIKPNQYKMMVRKALNFESISRWYNTTKSVMDNLRFAEDNNIKVSRRTLYNYCYENGINPKGQPMKRTHKATETNDGTTRHTEDNNTIQRKYEPTEWLQANEYREHCKLYELFAERHQKLMSLKMAI